MTARFHAALLRLRRPDEGATLVEYALLIALIAAVCFAAVVFLGEDTAQSLSNTTSRVHG